MSDTGEKVLQEMLLAGPRGRRLLLEYALASEERAGQGDREDSFSSAVFFASYHLSSLTGSPTTLWGLSAEDVELALRTPEEVAARMSEVPLAAATPELLLLCLSRSVDTARYWQEPDGQDLLAATSPMREALRRVAEHIAAAVDAQWWRTPVDMRTQLSVHWDGAPPPEVPADPLAVLRAARVTDIQAERHAVRERPADPAANFGGQWWSKPTGKAPSSARELFDGSPAGLWLVEDSLGWKTAVSTRLTVAAGLRVYEIDSADAWADLCRRFPREQTAQKRHDWYRTTGRAGRWVVPDWASFAEHYDAVHLQVAAYLAAAGTAIPVDADTASVIAGWGPDETYWFTPRIQRLDGSTAWVLEERGAECLWVRGGPHKLPRA